MKTLLTVAILVTCFTINASDKLEIDIVCEALSRGLKVEFKSNPYAWVNQALISEHGYFGEETLASFQIEKNQPFVTTPSFFNENSVAVYKARMNNDFHLEMLVNDPQGKHPIGPGKIIRAKLTSGEILTDIELSCIAL